MGNIQVITTGELLRQNRVGQNYLQLWQLNFPTQPTILELTREPNVGWEYASKVISEIHDEIIDPAEIRLEARTSNKGLETISPLRKTSFFFPCVSKSQVDPIWIIVESCLTEKNLSKLVWPDNI
jgi:hypothetical protein